MNTATETTAVEAATEVAVKVDGRANNGRKPSLGSTDAKFDMLVAIRDNDASATPSRFLTLQLAEAGLVTLETLPRPQGQRGRPRLVPVLTGKARSWVALIERNRARKAEKEAAANQVEVEAETQE